ncbi:MAG: HD domain-containing protein [Acidobacteria bacterium]|nr:HD domain-containing protein [Acidobacteriota bacterium]
MPQIAQARPALAAAHGDTRLETRALILLAGFSGAYSAMYEALEPHRLEMGAGAEQLLEILTREPVDLVILDGDAGGTQVLDWCRTIRADSLAGAIPILLLTGPDCLDLELAGAEAGADEFLAAPFHPEALRARVQRMLRYRTSNERLEESETLLFALAQAVEQRDQYTAGHCERLAVFSVAMGMSMRLSRPELLALHRGGYLHDIGKVGMPDAILFKPGSLTPAEWDMMRTHTIRGEQICRSMRCLAPVLPIIRSHHERWDGSGYPDRLKGPEIPLLAQVLQLADIFDALTTARPYKKALGTDEALAIMQVEALQGWRNLDLMRQFANLPLAALREKASQQIAECQDADAVQRSLLSLRLALG